MQAQSLVISAQAMRRTKRRETIQLLKALPFILPWILGFLGLTIYPIIGSFYYGLTRYSVVAPPQFIGLGNYQRIFSDKLVRIIFKNTLFFVVYGVPAGLVSSFLIANLLNNEIRGRSVWRTIFFIPSIVPAVSSVMVWLWIYNTQYGLVSGIFQTLKMQALPFLSDPKLVKPSMLVINMWAQGSAIIIFLAALQDVPRELYEAATIDGAGTFRRFWHITVPMCTSAMLYILVTHLIGTFQSFVFPYLLTNGGPNNASELYAVYVFRNAFMYFKMGYASALSWLLFIVILIFSAGVFLTSGRWVYYAG